MCLKIEKNEKFKTAKRDIVCYKRLKCRYKEMFTLYQNMAVEVGKEYCIDYDKFPTCPDSGTVFGRSINGNAFHSYKYKKNAVVVAKTYTSDVLCVVKCVIPKGSRYWEGTFDGVPSYASEKIKYCKVCKVIVGNKIPKGVKFIYEGDEVIGVDFLKLKKRILFKDVRENMTWDEAMAYAESLGMSLPTKDELKEMNLVLNYFKRVLFKYDDYLLPIWSSSLSQYSSGGAWYVNHYGGTYYGNKAYEFAVVPCADLILTN